MTYERFEEIASKNTGKKDCFFAEDIERGFGIAKQTVLNKKAQGHIRAEGRIGKRPYFGAKELHRFLNTTIITTA